MRGLFLSFMALAMMTVSMQSLPINGSQQTQVDDSGGWGIISPTTTKTTKR